MINIPIAKGIAFAALCASATVLEVFDKPAGGLWFLIVIWVLFGEWTNKEEEK